MSSLIGFDSYWQLNNYDHTLRDDVRKALELRQGRKIKRATLKRDMVPLMQRYDIGLLDHEKCSQDELQQFAAARHIFMPPESPKDLIVKKTNKADGKRNFRRFLNLLAELRESVYRIYLLAMPEELFCPSLPPLARANKQLRQEIVPIFCQMKTIHLQFRCQEYPMALGSE